MRAHGYYPTDEELRDMIKNVDTNRNGAIDFNEFIAMMADKLTKSDDDVVHAFRVFDRDGDGLISAEELRWDSVDRQAHAFKLFTQHRLTMNNLGEPVTEAEVKLMIEEADIDGDGKINFQEFKTLMATKLNGGLWNIISDCNAVQYYEK